MATVVSRGTGKVNTVTAATTLQLGDAGISNHAVGRWIVHYTLTGGSFSIKPQKAGTIIDPEVQNAYLDTWYTVANTNTEVAAGTTQTTSGIMDIDSAGCDTQLVITIAGGGSLAVIANPLLG